MPKVKPGKSRKGKNKASAEEIRLMQNDTEPTEMVVMSEEREEELIKKITSSVVNSLRHGNDVHGLNLVSNNSSSMEDDSSIHSETEIEVLENIQNSEFFNSTGSMSTPLASMVDSKVKLQIWQDKYIDLAILLPQNSTFSKRKGMQFQIVENSKLAVIPNKPRFGIYNIEQWTTAFIRYIAIYAEKFPDQVPFLLKHAELVRDLAQNTTGNSWQEYDQRYRLDRQVRGIPWGVFNMEFYIMATRGFSHNTFHTPNRSFRSNNFRPSNRGFRFRGRTPRVVGSSQPRFNRGFCWAYNRDGHCRIPSCRFSHKCSGCTEDHPLFQCPKHEVPKPNKPKATK